jgi:hypothetical protein
VSVDYIKDEKDREKWLGFWKKFAPNTIVDDRDKVIQHKLKCLVELQDTEGYRARHLEHFRDMVELYENVKEAEIEDAKIVKLKTKIGAWKLREKGIVAFALPNSFYLPSVYNPTFDYEGLEVTDLISIKFVSKAYSTLYPNAKEFLQYLGVGDSISANYVQVLTKPKAASRFWELWRNGTFNNFNFFGYFRKFSGNAYICLKIVQNASRRFI